MKHKGLSYWKKKADSEFSLWIRNSYNTKLGVQCYTCGRWYTVKTIQNGHFISRGKNILRFSEINCKPQCVGCNVFKKGDLITYRENLVKEYGEDKVKWLEAQRRTLKQWKWFELEEIYLKYKALNGLEILSNSVMTPFPDDGV